MSDGTGTTSYSYRPINAGDGVYGDGRLETVDGPLAGETLAYTYDEYGRLWRQTLNGAANEMCGLSDEMSRTLPVAEMVREACLVGTPRPMPATGRSRGCSVA